MNPQLVIMDVKLPDGNGIETARQLMKRLPHPRVIMYTYHDDELYLEQALLAGAQGYLLKSDPNPLILTALRAVNAGEIFVSPALADKWEQLQTRPAISHPLDSLSSRERQVLQTHRQRPRQSARRHDAGHQHPYRRSASSQHHGQSRREECSAVDQVFRRA